MTNTVVISLFDGLSGGRIALDRVPHINILRYYSSEVDPYAIKVADKNYPQDAKYRLGDITEINFYKLLQEIIRDFGKDVKIKIIGGSPCQGFSMAGKLKGSSTACGVDVTSLRLYMTLKKRGFEFNGQSYLFWEFVRALRTIKPKYFMLENVRVTKKWLPMFNEAMQAEPTRINSSLVSAQNRDRYYWHNFGKIPQPEDKGILLREILEKDTADRDKSFAVTTRIAGATKKRYLEKSMHQMALVRPCELKDFNENSTCHHAADATDIKGNESIKRVYAETGKSPAMATCQGGHREPKVLIEGAVQRGRYNEDGKVVQQYEDNGQEKSNALTTVQKDTLVKIDKIKNVNPSGNGMNGWVFGIDAKAPTCTTNKGEGNKISSDKGATYRKLTPLECERLQTLPDNYTEGVSNSQRYKMIGNGWTIDVVAHIFSHIPDDNS